MKYITLSLVVFTLFISCEKSKLRKNAKQYAGTFSITHHSSSSTRAWGEFDTIIYYNITVKNTSEELMDLPVLQFEGFKLALSRLGVDESGKLHIDSKAGKSLSGGFTDKDNISFACSEVHSTSSYKDVYTGKRIN